MSLELAYSRDTEPPAQAEWRRIESQMKKLLEATGKTPNLSHMLYVPLDTGAATIDEIRRVAAEHAFAEVKSHKRGKSLPGDIAMSFEYDDDRGWIRGDRAWSSKVIFDSKLFKGFAFPDSLFVFRSQDLRQAHPYAGMTVAELENALIERAWFDSTRNARDLIILRELCSAMRYALGRTLSAHDEKTFKTAIATGRLRLGEIGDAAYAAVRKEVEEAMQGGRI